jgi:cytochrome P450
MEESMQDRPVDWNPADPNTVPDRLEQMREMRRRCPIAWASRHGGQWDVLRYDDIAEITANPDIFGNALQTRYSAALPPLEYDPPEHRDVRRLLAVFFTPKRLKELEPRLRRLCAEMLEPMLGDGHGDLAQGLSYPLPVLALCALLNIPDEHWSDIKTWSENTFLMDSEDAGHRAIATSSHETIVAFALTMIEDRRKHPRHPEEDIASALLSARPSGAPMDDDTMARTLRLLISAGHNSTTSGIGNSLLHLAGNPEDQGRLRSEPGLIPTAIEEFLRLDTPVQEMPRFAKTATAVRGQDIAAGDRLGMFWASGNRDENAFPEPDRCILDRRPNRHLAFGNGIHTCLGAPLARLEMRVVLEEVLARTSSFELAGPPTRAEFHRMGVTALPVRLVAR